jgi:cytochrome c5
MQLVAGEKAFNNYCGGCHSVGFAESRLIRYRSADTLFEFLRMSMPPGNPESVTAQRHYDITAYLLADGGLLGEAQVVSADTAAHIVFQEPGEPAKPEQVLAGEKAYNRYCGSCHSGGFAESRVKRYGTAEKLFGFIRMSMPPGNPTQVGEQSHYDIAAYILAEHGLLEEGEVVRADSAGDVTFGD